VGEGVKSPRVGWRKKRESGKLEKVHQNWEESETLRVSREKKPDGTPRLKPPWHKRLPAGTVLKGEKKGEKNWEGGGGGGSSIAALKSHMVPRKDAAP